MSRMQKWSRQRKFCRVHLGIRIYLLMDCGRTIICSFSSKRNLIYETELCLFLNKYLYIFYILQAQDYNY